MNLLVQWISKAEKLFISYYKTRWTEPDYFRKHDPWSYTFIQFISVLTKLYKRIKVKSDFYKRYTSFLIYPSATTTPGCAVQNLIDVISNIFLLLMIFTAQPWKSIIFYNRFVFFVSQKMFFFYKSKTSAIKIIL